MSAGYSPPTTVLAHAHWTMGRSKMSKSRGNVVDPISAMEVYGVDSVRWYLMRAGGSLPEDSGMSKSVLQIHIPTLHQPRPQPQPQPQPQLPPFGRNIRLTLY